jgi:ATP-dependent Clp protease ATP-binding subunit ClpA
MKPQTFDINSITRNLNHLAKSKKIERAFGRKEELKKVTQILLRRTKRNPIIVGPAGVGKTALVEELAHSIAHQDAHYELHDYEIIELDTTALIAGTKSRGDYEENATQVLKYFEENQDKILMIDEIHNVLKHNSKNSFNSSIGITEIIKPALANGKICCIGATTYDEYVKYFQEDKALNRRFIPVFIEEPTSDETLLILQNIKKYYEDYHNCFYDESSLLEIIKYSNRYFSYRNFPDKAIDLIDEIGSNHAMSLKKDKKVITSIDVAEFVSVYLNIPLHELNETNMNKLSKINDIMKEEIFGQDEAINTLLKSLLRSECNLNDSNRPIASFLFYGPSGTGKTELTKILAKYYNYNLISFDMSEYMESYTISSLIGSPPGYIGYESGGLLTNKIKQNPYSIVLFDEIEKAHPQIYNLFLQILEDGVLHDNRGEKYNFKNAIIIMTSNVCSNITPNFGIVRESVPVDHTQLTQYFKPEFLNRIDSIVKFNHLSSDVLKAITYKCVFKTIHTLKINYSYEEFEEIVEYIHGISTCPRSIQRNIDKYIVDNYVECTLKKV